MRKEEQQNEPGELEEVSLEELEQVDGAFFGLLGGLLGGLFGGMGGMFGGGGGMPQMPNIPFDPSAQALNFAMVDYMNWMRSPEGILASRRRRRDS